MNRGLERKSTIERERPVLFCLVLAAIPTFYSSFFKLPMGIEQRLSGFMRKFLKGSNSGDCICTPKQHGGLGVQPKQYECSAIDEVGQVDC